MLIVMAKLHGSTIFGRAWAISFSVLHPSPKCVSFVADSWPKPRSPSAVAATNGAAHEPSERRLGDSTVPSERLPSSVTRLDPR